MNTGGIFGGVGMLFVGQEGDGLRFSRPWPFTSPSAAAAVVLDRDSNGPPEWKVRGFKENYHDCSKRGRHGRRCRYELAIGSFG